MGKSAKIIDIRTRKRVPLKRLRSRMPSAEARRQLARAGVSVTVPPMRPHAARFLAESFAFFFRKSIAAEKRRRAQAECADRTR